MTGRTEQAYPMMPECLRVGLFETRQLFINLQRTLIVRSVCSELDGQVRTNNLPLRIRQHRHFTLAAPTIERLRHLGTYCFNR